LKMNPVKLILTTHPSSLKRQAMSGVALTLLLVFICLLAGTGRAAAAQTVTVGYYYDSDYMYKTKSGEHRGYDIELLYELAKYTGWRYKFIDYKDWDDCYSALLAGKIDVLPALFWSKERAAQMIFSNKKMTDVYITVITRTNDAKYSYGDASALSGARIGILKNSLDAESFKKWCAKQKLNVRTVELDGTEEMLKALDEGKIDAASVTYLGRNYNYRIIAEFDPQPLFFAFPRDRGLVKKQLDDAMDKLAIANPGFDVSMRKKYFSQSAKIAPAFTKQERDYIAQKH
jgi:ABC-type amino acid transport substrate-binding protein